MKLEQVFESLRPSIVAFGSKLARGRGGSPPLMPPLLGTGFVVHPDGVVATNRHVAEALAKLPRHPNTGEFLGFCLVFSAIREETEGLGLDAHIVNIHGFQSLSEFESDGQFYSERVPGIAFVQLRVRDLPPAKLATTDWSIRVGMDVATAGFPLGEDPLVVHGVIGQGTPLLKRGIVSAVNPFPCPQPDGFTIDVMSQGGASGSPIFRSDEPEVIGILYAGFPGTNITFAVPSLIVRYALELFMRTHYESLADTPSLQDLPRSSETQTAFPADSWEAV